MSDGPYNWNVINRSADRARNPTHGPQKEDMNLLLFDFHVEYYKNAMAIQDPWGTDTTQFIYRIDQ